MKFGVLPALAWSQASGGCGGIARGIAIANQKFCNHGLENRHDHASRQEADNDLDDVNAAFSRIYHSNGLGQVSET
jgi:hypothetical protein